MCLIIPKLMSAPAAFTASRTDGSKLSVLRLAVIQSGTKKTAVTGTVICTAVKLLTSSLYVLSRSAEGLYSARNYDCDVIIRGISERAERYDIITAGSREFIYNTEETVQKNGKNAAVSIFGYDGFEMFPGLHDLPEKLDDSEFIFDTRLMKRLGISADERILRRR